MNQESYIYSKNTIEFVTVAAETCLFLEHASENTKEDFVTKSLKILALLYLKTILVDVSEIESDENIERFVGEEDYLFVKEQVEQLLGADDTFLEVFHPDMPYSDTPIACFISENLADIYQELKDFAANFQIGDEEIMSSALHSCIDGFAIHWGQKLLNVMRALHSYRFSDNFGIDEEDDFNPDEYRKVDRNSFLNFQKDEE